MDGEITDFIQEYLKQQARASIYSSEVQRNRKLFLFFLANLRIYEGFATNLELS